MKRERGFTIVEVLVAVLILTVGVLGLTGTAASVTRMIRQGAVFSEASTLASERIEILRGLPCGRMTSSSETRGPFSVAWQVTTVANGRAREVTVAVRSPNRATTRTNTFSTIIGCQ